MWPRWREGWRRWRAAARLGTAADRAFLEEVLALFPYAEEAKIWLRANIAFTVQDHASTRGGGYWDHAHNLVFLHTGQYEATISEPPPTPVDPTARGQPISAERQANSLCVDPCGRP